MVRQASKARGLREAGAEVVIGDFDQAETLYAAFSGVEKVFLLTAATPDQVSQARNGIAAARRAGGPPIVRLSAGALKPAGNSRARVMRQHDETDAELAASGLPYTILRPHFFMQNTMSATQTVASDGAVYMPMKDGKLGMIDVRDIVDVATGVLTHDGHEGLTYGLTGPAPISFHDVAAELSKALGKDVTYGDVSLEAGRKAMVGMGASEWLADAFNEYAAAIGEGFGDFVTGDVEKLTGNPARSFATFARDFAQAFSGGPTGTSAS